jgi:hypothetical protein
VNRRKGDDAREKFAQRRREWATSGCGRAGGDDPEDGKRLVNRPTKFS